MVEFPKKLRCAVRLLIAIIILSLAFGTSLFAQGNRYKSGSAWSFGVMGDTQWTVASDPEGKNPDRVSAAIAVAIEQQFINRGVRFVIQPGDLSDTAGAGGMTSRAAAAQHLFDAGIGFFPLRGNHETYGYLYGLDPLYNLNVPDFKAAFPQTQGNGPNLFGATNFSWPTGTTNDNLLKGLSYSFDYNNARFVAVDVEQTSVKHQAAPNNPDSCVNALKPVGAQCGQGYFYVEHTTAYNTGFTVYKAPQDITNGYAIPYDAAGNALTKVDPITITAGTWFRIASNGRPTTDFKAYDMLNPNQKYNGQPWDIYWPIDDNITSAIDSSANTEFFPGKQQTWISMQLDKNTRGTEHAFVFSHRAIIAENHTDSFFGADPSVTPADQNAFLASLANNGVKYMISAHDHLHNHALVSSPDGASTVMQQITTGASTKFYTPTASSNFPAGIKGREIPISQELLNLGYYIYTIDGPRVTAEYYSDATGHFMDDADYPYGDASKPVRLFMPQFTFVKKETWGYSQNGQQFSVAQGNSYTGVQDTFNGTSAKILAGTNNSTTTDNTPVSVDKNGAQISGPRPLTKTVNTGWVDKSNTSILASNVFSLWGMTELGNSSSDPYVLQMSYAGSTNGLGGYRLVSLDPKGNWVRAASLNFGKPATKFVRGSYNGSLTPGTYGIDETSKTVWAVLNYDADFAVYNFPELSTQTSGFVYNRSTKAYTGTLTVTNISDEPVRQVSVVLTKMISGSILVNKTGATAAGDPYITMTITGMLKPGASVSIPVTLTGGSTFTPVAYAY